MRGFAAFIHLNDNEDLVGHVTLYDPSSRKHERMDVL
jgi:hypothetical protein